MGDASLRDRQRSGRSGAGGPRRGDRAGQRRRRDVPLSIAPAEFASIPAASRRGARSGGHPTSPLSATLIGRRRTKSVGDFPNLPLRLPPGGKLLTMPKNRGARAAGQTSTPIARRSADLCQSPGQSMGEGRPTEALATRACEAIRRLIQYLGSQSCLHSVLPTNS